MYKTETSGQIRTERKCRVHLSKENLSEGRLNPLRKRQEVTVEHLNSVKPNLQISEPR